MDGLYKYVIYISSIKIKQVGKARDKFTKFCNILQIVAFFVHVWNKF